MDDSDNLDLDRPVLSPALLRRAAGGPSQSVLANLTRLDRAEARAVRLSPVAIDGRNRFPRIDAFRLAVAVELWERGGVPLKAVQLACDDIESRIRAIMSLRERPPAMTFKLDDDRWSRVWAVKAYSMKDERLQFVFGAASFEQIAEKEFAALPLATVWLQIDRLIVGTAQRLGFEVRGDSVTARTLRSRADELVKHLDANAALAETDD